MFTLIELPFIGIIAILTSVLLPALSNQKQLSFAFYMFSSDSYDIILAYANCDGYWSVPATLAWNLAVRSLEQSSVTQQTCLKAPGTDPLCEYPPNTGVIHCPGDIRLNNIPASGGAFGSYSKPKISELQPRDLPQ